MFTKQFCIRHAFDKWNAKDIGICNGINDFNFDLQFRLCFIQAKRGKTMDTAFNNSMIFIKKYI